jgi:hypothetical protein
MYELRSESIQTFINDASVTLPRFQRKLTWSPNKNFNLALSLFRGYPLGVVVIKREGSSRKFLLDGRQRLNGLKSMAEVETLYGWAKRSLRIKNSSTPEEIFELFSAYLDDYFGQESAANDAEPTGDFGNADLAEDLSDDELDEEVEEPGDLEDAESLSSTESQSPDLEGSLNDLLRLILLVHPKTKYASRFTKLFDFSKLLDDLAYVKQDALTGKSYVSPEHLRVWIGERRRYASIEGNAGNPTADEFLGWLRSGTQLTSSSDEADLRELVEFRWPQLNEAFQLLARLDTKFQESQIGYLELKESDADDDKKIFEIINTAGTPLTAAEILSAKPDWNVGIPEPAPELADSTLRLYKALGIPYEGDVVRWDYGATILDRLELPFILGESTGISETDFQRKVTLSFQLMSGYYSGKIAKNDISELPRKQATLSWGSLQLETDVNTMAAHLAAPGRDFFQFWQSWNLPVIDALSDAVGLAFILVLVSDWKRKGRPGPGAGARFNAFFKNAVTLFDTLVFEYVTGRWAGSSDSRIARSIAAIDTAPDVFEPVSLDSWSSLVNGVIDDGLIEGKAYTGRMDARIRLLLHYYNAIRHKMGPGGSVAIHVDHIIPQTAFETAHGAVKNNRHSIANLALLPPEVNQYKSDKWLAEVSSGFMGQQLSALIDVPLEDFGQYTTVASSEQLKTYRGNILREYLVGKRQELVDEPGAYQP